MAQFAGMNSLMNKEGIQAVALKGIYLAEQLYPKIGLRQFSDIDLLFRIEDAEKALAVFTRLGYTMVKPAFGEAVTTVFESAHLPPLTRKGVSVELHTRLHGPTQSYRLPDREMADRAIELTIHGQAFRVFELHDLLIHLCLHHDKHFNGSHMQLYALGRYCSPEGTAGSRNRRNRAQAAVCHLPYRKRSDENSEDGAGRVWRNFARRTTAATR